MNKKMMVLPLIALLLMAPILVLAGPSTTDMTWDGAGLLQFSFLSDNDASLSFKTYSPTWIGGQLYAEDKGDNPYSYGVDTTIGWVKANVNNGYIQYDFDRIDSKTSYCLPGQNTYTYVGTEGLGYLNWKTTINYAAMTNAQYSFATTNFGVDGPGSIYHSVTGASGDWASIGYSGTGKADIKLQGETAGTTFNMGCLPVCGDGEAWDNNYAKFTGNGVGTFTLTGSARDGLTLHEGGVYIPGDGSLGSAFYSLRVGYAGSWVMPDFGIKGK